MRRYWQKCEDPRGAAVHCPFVGPPINSVIVPREAAKIVSLDGDWFVFLTKSSTCPGIGLVMLMSALKVGSLNNCCPLLSFSN